MNQPTKLPLIKPDSLAFLASIGIVWALAKILDPAIVWRAPVDMATVAPSYVMGLDAAPQFSFTSSHTEAELKCPGAYCPLNKSPALMIPYKKPSLPFPMLDDKLLRHANHTLYVRIETTVPEFAKTTSELALDVLGIQGKSWRYFVNGALVSKGAAGSFSGPLVFSTANLVAGESLVLGFEIEIGDSLAPGIHPVSQVFLTTPELSKMVRDTYRSADASVVTPIVYAFASVGLMAALGAFFTPFYGELIYLATLTTAWIYRHLYANKMIDLPAIFASDAVTNDALFKVIQYVSLIGFFNFFFRFRRSWSLGILIALVASAVTVRYANLLGLQKLPVLVVEAQNLILSLTLGFGSVAAGLSWLSVRKRKRATLRKVVTLWFMTFLSLASAAFFARHFITVYATDRENLNFMYSLRQFYSLWMHVLVSTTGAAIALEWAQVVYERQKLMQRFGMILDKKLFEEITSADHFVSKKCNEVVAMVVDLRGFTRMCDELPASQVVETLNDFLSLVAESIQSCGGTVDKFIGDGVLAMWGISEQSKTDVDRALSATQVIAARIEKLNHSRRLQNLPMLSYGIGLHYGSAIFGAIGSDAYTDYTAIGPVVNIASRIQELTKEHDVTVLMTEEVKIRASMDFGLTLIGTTTIRGVTAKTAIYQLLGSNNTKLKNQSISNLTAA